MKKYLTNAHIVSPDIDYPCGAVAIEDEFIVEVLPDSAGISGIDLGGNILMPGFFDIHVHGCGGDDFCDGTVEGVRNMARHKLSQGVTSFLGTTMTLPEADTAAALRCAAEYTAQYGDGAKIPGIHLEGPFFAPNCVGAQNPAYLKSPDIEFVDRMNRIYPVSKVSYSLELDPDFRFVRELVQRNIMPAAAHTAATYEQFKSASAIGLKHLSHFCNVMTPLHHLRFGIVGGGLLHKDIFLEIICDGIHLCPEMIQLIFEVRKCDHVMLITDSMRAAGMPDGDYLLGGQKVIVKDHCARIESGAVAGSTLLYYQGLRHVRKLTGLPLPELVKTTSWNQARSLGIPRIGKIESGFRADLAILNSNLEPQSTWVNGRELWKLS